MATTPAAAPTGAAVAVCEARVDVVGGRYPYRPVCSCGWSTWGYVAPHAAQILVDAHMAGERC